MAKNDKKENIHKDHRRRVKDRFLNHGLDSFEDHLVLELLLYYTIPRMDVNDLAHKLINAMGSLHAVLDAPVEELLKIPGIGENTAVLLKLIPQINRRYLISRENSSGKVTLDGSKAAGRYIVPLFYSERDEVIYIISLDNENKVISCRPTFRGDLNSATVSIRKIVEHALRDNATSVIMAHNHTSGAAQPSEDDIKTTSDIDSALKAVEIKLADHIIVAGSDYMSMLESGLI